MNNNYYLNTHNDQAKNKTKPDMITKHDGQLLRLLLLEGS